MSIFSFFKKKRVFFSVEDNQQIINAIKIAEKGTSGEIRIYVEGKNSYVDALERAKEIFFELKMEMTKERNAVLLYIAMDDKQLALFADEGIYQRVGAAYWDNAVKEMIAQFTSHHISSGIEKCVLQVGETLKAEFPFKADTDKNELPDDIVFGK